MIGGSCLQFSPFRGVNNGNSTNGFLNTEKSILVACKYRKIDPNPQNIGVLGAKSGLKKSIFLRKTP